MPLPRTRPASTIWRALFGLFAPLSTRAEPRLAYTKGDYVYTARARDGKGEKRVCKGLYPGQAAWTRPLAQLTGEEQGSSAAQYTIAVDGRLISTRPTPTPEIPALETNMSCDYLMVADLTKVKPQRLTPKRFAVLDPYVSTDGRSVYLVGICGREVRIKPGGDGTNLDAKQRVYRYDLSTGKLTPLVEDGTWPSVSRD